MPRIRLLLLTHILFSESENHTINITDPKKKKLKKKQNKKKRKTRINRKRWNKKKLLCQCSLVNNTRVRSSFGHQILIDHAQRPSVLPHLSVSPMIHPSYHNIQKKINKQKSLNTHVVFIIKSWIFPQHWNRNLHLIPWKLVGFTGLDLFSSDITIVDEHTETKNHH